jgi:hypothetical protein
VQRIAKSETGRVMIGDMGHEAAMRAIREDVVSRHGNSAHD